jgi:hypothetical protein
LPNKKDASVGVFLFTVVRKRWQLHRYLSAQIPSRVLKNVMSDSLSRPMITVIMAAEKAQFMGYK